MKEDIFHIQLVERPPMRQCNCKDKANCGWFNHWTKNFSEINSKSLMKAFNN